MELFKGPFITTKDSASEAHNAIKNRKSFFTQTETWGNINLECLWIKLGFEKLPRRRFRRRCEAHFPRFSFAFIYLRNGDAPWDSDDESCEALSEVETYQKRLRDQTMRDLLRLELRLVQTSLCSYAQSLDPIGNSIYFLCPYCTSDDGIITWRALWPIILSSRYKR